MASRQHKLITTCALIDPSVSSADKVSLSRGRPGTQGGTRLSTNKQSRAIGVSGYHGGRWLCCIGDGASVSVRRQTTDVMLGIVLIILHTNSQSITAYSYSKGTSVLLYTRDGHWQVFPYDPCTRENHTTTDQLVPRNPNLISGAC